MITKQPPLLRWVHFLANRDPARYDELVRFDPGWHNAMTTLKTLSQDEKTRMLAQAREEYTRLHYEDLRASRKEGRQEGRQ